jgi:hypothetical protein
MILNHPYNIAEYASASGYGQFHAIVLPLHRLYYCFCLEIDPLLLTIVVRDRFVVLNRLLATPDDAPKDR